MPLHAAPGVAPASRLRAERAWLQISELAGLRAAPPFLVLPVAHAPPVWPVQVAPRESGTVCRVPLALPGAALSVPAPRLSSPVQPVSPVRANPHVPGPRLAAVDLAAPSLRRFAALPPHAQVLPEQWVSRRRSAWHLPQASDVLCSRKQTAGGSVPLAAGAASAWSSAGCAVRAWPPLPRAEACESRPRDRYNWRGCW